MSKNLKQVTHFVELYEYGLRSYHIVKQKAQERAWDLDEEITNEKKNKMIARNAVRRAKEIF